MDMDKIYHDSAGNECNIYQMVNKEPEWACNMIQNAEDALNRERQRADAATDLLVDLRAAFRPIQKSAETGIWQVNRFFAMWKTRKE